MVGRNSKMLSIGGGASLLCLMFAAFANAESSECKLRSYDELLKCAVKQSQEIQISDQQLRAANNLEGIARQWINPELEAEAVKNGSEKTETSAALLFDIRLGGKRGAAIQEAKGETQKAQAERDLGFAQAKLDLILKFYKLSHLGHEIKIEEESVGTFSKIIKQYQGKAALSPEQDVSLSVFRMALSDHELNLVKLKGEQDKLLQEVVVSTKIAKEDILKNIPQHKFNWPEITKKGPAETSPHVRFSRGELMVAQGQKDKADADSWPDIKIGPTIKMQKDAGVSENSYGLALTMPLPLFSLNGSGREYGTQKLIAAEMNHSLSERKVVSMREQLIRKYQTTVATLKTSITDKSADEKHERIERHFFRGLVSSSLVIEAHRQLIELEERRNESEREALEALGSILIIDNEFSEVVL